MTHARRITVHDFASARKDGEEWETNGRAYKRTGGKTIRVASKDSRAKPEPTAAPQASKAERQAAPAPAPPEQRTGRLRKLALEWGPKVRSIPAMLPGLVGTGVLGGLGAITGTPGAVMLGSIGAGGMLNKAMDRGAKRAKQIRTRMARTPAEKRWAAKRNKDAYFAELADSTAALLAVFG